ALPQPAKNQPASSSDNSPACGLHTRHDFERLRFRSSSCATYLTIWHVPPDWSATQTREFCPAASPSEPTPTSLRPAVFDGAGVADTSYPKTGSALANDKRLHCPACPRGRPGADLSPCRAIS